ncbi:MAG TPA: adenine deaminase [Chloroflexi bacterium]|nr:adenine deaminase [Chloroflexota bacterium]HHW87485.1 adenine deaminase [Chloroflexota bacterium]
MDKQKLLAVARGDEPADLVLRGGRVVNVFSGEVETATIAIVDGLIAGIGDDYAGHDALDLHGAFVTPGLIDAHVHIESSLCTPAQFAQAVVPHGVTTVVIDPHEIANVVGMAGLRFMAQSSVGLPLSVVVMASSCVPATHMETNGATLAATELARLLDEGTVYGLAEVMNFPGVVNGDPAVLAKLTAFAGRPRDGHAPALSGKQLNAYIASGIGSEHECTTVAEAREKLARGLYILIREATNAHNLHALLPMIDAYNSRRLCFCTDDRIPSDLIDQGSIDYMVREAIRFGIPPITALRMATLNTTEWFGLHDRGAISPGRRADLMVCDDLETFRPRLVFAGGRLVAEEGVMRGAAEVAALPTPPTLSATVNLRWEAIDLRIPATGRRLRVIGSLPNQLVTEERILPATVHAGLAVADPARDLLKMAVIERHRASGAQGLGFIQGIGLQRGAMAGTVAHDHHNLVVIGADDASMLAAVRAVAAMGGGLAVAEGNEVRAALPLPVAGLMSDRPIAEVRRGYDALIAAAHALGSPLHDPFMAMSFMALEVIPKLKLTDQGLVDVAQFAIVPLFVD